MLRKGGEDSSKWVVPTKGEKRRGVQENLSLSKTQKILRERGRKKGSGIREK